MEDELMPGLRYAAPHAERPIALPRLRLSARTVERLLYAGAAVSYVAISVFVTEFALSWVVGVGWLLLWVWVLPAIVRRLRR
jgi:hypothetical protein